MADQNLETRIARLEEEVARLKQAWRGSQPERRPEPGPAVLVNTTPNTPAAAGRDWFSIETYMGANVLGRAGIFALLLALAWFIKLAIDRQWINESMRIAIGFAVGTGFALWALYMARSRATLLAQAVAGAAFGAFYISVSSAHYFYNLTGLTETFIALALISSGAAFLSIRAGSEILYLFSYAGAFAAPFILSRGENSYQFLFSYLTAVQLLFYYVSRKTTLYHSAYLILICGYALFGIWAVNRLDESSFPVPFLYLCTLAATLLLHQIDSVAKYPERSLHAPALLTLINIGAFQYFATMLVDRFYPSFTEHQAVLTAALLFALVGKRTRIASPIFAMAMTFALAAAVLFADGPVWIYLLVALAGSLSLSERMLGESSPLVRILGYLIWPGTIIALFFFLVPEENRLLWNSRFAAFLLAALLAGGLYYFEQERLLKRIFAYLALTLLLFAFFKENQDHVYDPQRRNLGYTLILLAFSAALLVWGFTRSRTGMRQAGLILATLTALKFFSYDILTLGTGVRIVAGIAVGTGLILAGLYYQRLQKQAVMGFLLALLCLPVELRAERIRLEGFRFLRSTTLPGGDGCGQLLLPLDIYRHSSLKELRLMRADVAIPYTIQNVKQPDKADRLPARQIFEKSTRHSTIRVYALPEPPAGKQLTQLSMIHPGDENFEASITLETSTDGEDWAPAGHHSLYVYSTDAPRSLHIRGGQTARYVRLEISGAPLLLRHALYESSIPLEYSIEDAAFTISQDGDVSATVIRVESVLPVERLELNFQESEYDRSLDISAFDPVDRQFDFLLRSSLRRGKKDEGNHSILLPEAAPGDLKIRIFNGSDEPLNLSELRLFVPQKEMLFPLSDQDGEARLYYGNRYIGWPDYDFDPDNCQSWKKATVADHTENQSFAYSLLEPPLSIYLLRLLFVVLFGLTLFLGYRAFGGLRRG